MVKTPLGGPFGLTNSPQAQKEHLLGPIQKIDLTKMRHFDQDDEVDFAIVGCGAGGGVLSQRLARAGFRVVVFDAGPFWDVERDWVSDEHGSHKLYWNELRITGGKDPLALGSNNSGRGVGGSTVHWAGFTPRLHPSDFRIHSEDGVGVDWPMSYWDLKPYYEQMEYEIPVSGPPYYPWGDPHGYSYGPHPAGGVTDKLMLGCTRMGIRFVPGGPVAINAGSHADRPHCIYRGFCIQGCKVGAKQSTLYSHVPDAIRHGAEVRANCMVSRVDMGKDSDGTPIATGVTYFDRDGHEHRQRAKVIVVSGYSIETPRLLLNSACPGFENGLANSSDTVGRYLMSQAGNVVMGWFPDLVRMYKVPPANGLTEEFYETDPKRGFARGFAIQTVGPLPITFGKEMAVAKGAWGWGLRQVMMDYNHWAAWGVLGEILPHAENRVTLASDKDRFGIPVAKVSFNLQDNDKKLIDFAVPKTAEIMWAAGAEEVVQEPRYAHLVGAARMGSDPRTSVCDSFGRTWDVPNLMICDGSVMPTQGSANPGLTIQALAARTADYLITAKEDVRKRRLRPIATGSVPLRKDLAPAGTSGRGVPRYHGESEEAYGPTYQDQKRREQRKDQA